MRLAILDADLAVFRYTWIERIVQAAARLTRPTCVDHGFPSLLPSGLVQTLDEGGASRALSRLSWAIPFPRSEFREKQHTSASQHVEVLDEYARQGFKFAKRCDLLVPNVGDILGGRFTMTKLRGWMLSDDSRRIDEDFEWLICDYIFVMDPATGLLVFFTCSADLSSVDDLADFSSLADVTSGLCLIPSQQASTVRFMLKGTYNLQHCLLLYSIEDNKGFVVISHCALISIIRPLIATQHFHRDLATTRVMFWEAIQKGNSCVPPSEYPATDGFFQDIGTKPIFTAYLSHVVQLPGPHGDIQIAAQILALFVLKGEGNAIFAVISRYVPLSDADAEQDPYPQFGVLAGCLYYDEVEAPMVTRASHLLAPFAKTPFKLDCIVKPVVHVLPLYKDHILIPIFYMILKLTSLNVPNRQSDRIHILVFSGGSRLSFHQA
ncbi:hypothetical protein EDD15DRAFT_2369625 [Pisolithus albus]|nr:hypothetical protein EDD15DRAFT_2369625 [Pisolithus albus]